MADGPANPPAIRMDPALAKYADIQVNRYRYFRWTPRTAWLSFVYIVAVPLAIGSVAYATEGKYDFRGKRRGDPISEF